MCEMLMNEFAVSAEDLLLGYGSKIAIHRSSFEIPRERVTAVIGPNGSGKSTLLSAIAGLLQPLAGRLDVPARGEGPQRISYVLQRTKVNSVLPVTVREVVAMGRYAGSGAYRRLTRADKEAVTEAMRRTGVEAIAGNHIQELSGGQQQRVFVAQGLAQDHGILLLDEPLTGIDLPTSQAINDVIYDERTRGCTVILTTHDLTEAQIADHVLLLAGRVVSYGEPREVLTREHLSAAYGPSLLHVVEGEFFIDDPAHIPVPGRHVHLERSIHPDSPPVDTHGDT